jgi:hypothetical protein
MVFLPKLYFPARQSRMLLRAHFELAMRLPPLQAELRTDEGWAVFS